ncbi:transglutaminase family protein [Rhodobacteraceae bacterium RKSG542]|uniref:transglutaminase-like domain-containing protein n=1 Tax=Pseudovibrio flavus TaxID=2529854 RepID=UPI0012BD76A9|nr:transglutaminase family protein [Pseudovibrio flavus]MTI17290.1 transglutaminase family protein [Pseudovibrio flavus]
MDQNAYLEETEMLDFSAPLIADLAHWKKWLALPEAERAGAIYDFVRNDIAFGYNSGDTLTASEVLADGYGQCNTKGTLLMALLRKGGIPCRFHGFTIYKELQAGAIPPLLQRIAPDEIIHSWVEAFVNGKWIKLEGFIIDEVYMKAVQRRFSGSKGTFKGYGIATKDLQNPQVKWTGGDTFIQKEGIAQDFGIYDRPEDFYGRFGSNLSGIKKWAYKLVLRHWMNWNVERIRSGH